LEEDQAINRVYKNVRLIFEKTPTGWKRSGHCTMIKPSLGLMPLHYVAMAQTKQWKVTDMLELEVAAFDETDIVKLDNKGGDMRDICMFVPKRPVQSVSDISAHIAPRNTPRKYVDGALMLTKEGVHPTRVEHRPQSVKYTEGFSHPVSIVAHTCRTKVGQCGAPLCLANQRVNGRFLGIHVAGMAHGYYSPIYREDFETAAPQLAGFEELQKVQPAFNNGDTNFVRTRFAGQFGPITGEPAALRPRECDGVVVDPMMRALQDTFRDFTRVEIPKSTQDCVHAVVSEIFATFGDDPLEDLSFEEAVAGLPDDKFVRSIARGKSMGYPLFRKYPNKRQAFGNEGAFVFDTVGCEEVRALRQECLDAYNKGLGAAVFRDVLKDEIRPFHKVEQMQTRLISASPVQFTILVKQMFGRFAAAFMRHRLDHGGLVGVNPYSFEWSIVYDKMRTMNKKGLAASGDFKQFDKSQHPEILKMIMMEIAKRLPHYEQNEKTFAGIARDTYNSMHFGGDSKYSDVIYQTLGSLPSGHPLTSIINSIYNMVVFRLAWVDKKGVGAILDFRKEVTLYVYGDDNMFAPTDAHIDFNMLVMEAFCPRIGMVYTSEDKLGKCYDLKDVNSISFLKRRFQLDLDGYVYAPLERDSINDMFNWRKKKSTDAAHLVEISQASLMEYCAYDFGTFQDHFVRLRKLCFTEGVEDPAGGVVPELAYRIFRSRYRGYTPLWSTEE